MEKTGPFLKAQREQKGIHLEEIASITKVNLRNLKLLEEGRWDELPPDPFVRGFILAYARYVGLDPRKVLEHYFEEKKGTSAPQGQEIPAAPMESRNPHDVIRQSNTVPVRKIALTSAVAVGVLVIGVLIFIGKNMSQIERSEEIASAPVAQETKQSVAIKEPFEEVRQPAEVPVKTEVVEKAEKVPEKPVEKVEAPAPTPPVAVSQAKPTLPAMVPIAPKKEIKAEKKVVEKKVEEKKKEEPVKVAESSETEEKKENQSPSAEGGGAHELSIETNDRTWLKVVIDDKPARETFLSKGDKVHYSAQKKLKIVLGNSAVAKVVHNGEVTKGEKLNGTIRTFIFPTGSRFPQDIPRKNASAKSPKSEEPESSVDQDF